MFGVRFGVRMCSFKTNSQKIFWRQDWQSFFGYKNVFFSLYLKESALVLPDQYR